MSKKRFLNDAERLAFEKVQKNLGEINCMMENFVEPTRKSIRGMCALLLEQVGILADIVSRNLRYGVGAETSE